MSKPDRIGIFGGTFNPVHLGHLNSALTVLRKLKLDKLFIVPAPENPLKVSVEGPSAEQRLQMVKLGFEVESDKFVVDDQEIKRANVSYSIETIRHFASKFGSDNIFFIMGADSFQEIDLWKNYEDILKETNLIVTTRPNSLLPLTVKEFPAKIQNFVTDFDFSGIPKLKTGRQIHFIQLKDLDISSSQVRKKLQAGRSVDSALSMEVENYIKENDIYPQISKKVSDFDKFIRFCAQVLFDKKALSVKGFDLRKIDAPTEYTLIASGTSSRATTALAENIIRSVKEEYGVNPLSLEGATEGRWVLVDYGMLIIHLFYEPVRAEYRLEDLWKKGVDLNLQDISQK